MTAHFTPLEETDIVPFPGAFTKLYTGAREVKEGDIISIEWDMERPDKGNLVTGKVASIEFVENRSTTSLDTKISFEEGWYTHGLETILTPEPGSDKDADGNSLISFKPKILKASRVGRWILSTNDVPAWRIYVLGADSDERNEFLRRHIRQHQ